MSRLRIAFAASLALCALSVGTGTAVAAPQSVPSGNSGAVQYTETVPGVGGNQTSNDLHEGKKSSGKGQGNGKGNGKQLSAADAARLEAQGKEGKKAAQLAGDGSPATSGKGEGGAHGAGDGESSGNGSGAGQVVGAATGSSDSGAPGWLLPLLIAAGVLAAIALVIVRRRPPPASD